MVLVKRHLLGRVQALQHLYLTQHLFDPRSYVHPFAFPTAVLVITSGKAFSSQSEFVFKRGVLSLEILDELDQVANADFEGIKTL
jgi:hypothetical protein